MLSLVTMAGATEVYLLGYYILVFVSIKRLCASGRVRKRLPLLRQSLSREAFLYLEVGSGHVSCVGTPPDTT